ncbi:MAG TPA: glycosyltransferase family 39 protein [Burkholderiales bacterium]|nr:glycosyltransferase family 39 protein [Burkholderiales bacterium]
MNRRLLERGFIVAVSLIVLGIWFLKPSGTLIEKDAEQNLAMAYNLRHYGIMSLDTDRASSALRPSRYREPVPVLVLSGYLLALDPLFDDTRFTELLRGGNAKLLKYSNVLWGALLIWVMVLTTRQLGMPNWMAALAVLLGHLPLVAHYDTLYSEVSGAALIALASFLCFLAVKTRRAIHFLAAGLSFGLLILTKASFLYVAIALLVIYVAYALIRADDRRQRGVAMTSAILVVVGTVLIVAPWMLRNQMQFGSPNLADRGGLVLMTRAVKNGMTRDEYIGAFYAYAPRVLQAPMGWLTGHRPKDLRAGGSLERLKRGANLSDEKAAAEGRVDDTVSYYWRAKAMRAPLLAKFEAEGHHNPLAAADAQLQKEAMAMIKANPRDHAAMTLPFMWRGAPFMFPFFLFMLFYAWRRRDVPLAAYVLPTLGLIGFYAVLSHFIPRYAEPNAPIAAICFVLLLHRWRKRKVAEAK